jgi:hypothetical protein
MPLHTLACITEPRRSCGRLQRGSVLVELALVTPIILIIAGFTVRLVQILQARQIASVLSREIATDAYRNCMDFTLQNRTVVSGVERLVVDTVNTAPILAQCLGQIRTRFMGRWDALRPAGTQANTPLTLNVWVYRYDFQNFSVSDATCSATTTRISWDGEVLESDDINAQSMCRRNRAVRVNVSFSITPSLVFLSLIPGGNFTETVQISDTTEI